MPIIKIRTKIKAEPEVVFNLSRSIDFHLESTKQTNEKVIKGRSSGLMQLGEKITWRAKHFGIYQNLTVKVTEYQEFSFFVDEMTKGIFKSFRHEHHFNHSELGTEMIDIFDYQSPFSFLGKIMDYLIVKKHLTNFLIVRNNNIKYKAESLTAGRFISEL